MLQAKKAKLDSSNETADGQLATAAIEIKTLQEQKLNFSGQINEMSSQINEMSSQINEMSSQINEMSSQINEMSSQINKMSSQINEMSSQINEMSSQINEINEDYQKLKFIINPTSQGKTKRVKNPTTNEMVNDSSCSTRYVRRNETKDVLEYIHGGTDSVVFGSFDFLKKHASPEQMEEFLLVFKKREVYPKAPWEIFKHFQEFCRWDEASNCHKIQASFV